MFQDLKKEFPSTLLLILVLILSSWILFQGKMSLYPSYVHAWTQSDRIALAQNFQENGFDFFHPATYNLLTKDGITQVDFPIHDYLVAGISSIFSTDIIKTFRWYNLLYTWLGLIFLFRLGLGMGLSGRRSLFACLFLSSLPFWVYYQNGFLPSNPSISNLFIALFYFHTYWKSGQSRSLYLSFLFFTLAALARSPFLIYGIAAFVLLLFRQSKGKRIQFKEWISGFISLGLFVSYWFYNRMLAEEYGSMFLGFILPIDSFEDVKYLLSNIANRWVDDLLSPFHGIILLIMLVQVLFSKQVKVHALFLWLCFSALGVFAFVALFGLQFVDHDYYYIDSFLPLFSIFLLLLLNRFKLDEKWYSPFAILCFIFSFYFISYASENLNERYTPKWNDRVHYSYEIYEDVKDRLSEWGIKPTDTLTILEANSTNIPFTIWGNKGYTSLNSHRDSVISILKKPTNYITIIDSFFRVDAFRDYPELIQRLDRVGGNGEITFYKKTDDPKAVSFFEHLHFYGHYDFDGQFPDSNYFGKYIPTIEVNAPNNRAHLMNFEIEYGLTFKKDLKIDNLDKNLQVILLADFYQAKELSKMQLVCQLGEHYFPQYLENSFTKVDQWDYKQYRFNIPSELLKPNQEIKVYFWNQLKKEIQIDNYHLLIYQ